MGIPIPDALSFWFGWLNSGWNNAPSGLKNIDITKQENNGFEQILLQEIQEIIKKI